MSLMLSIHDLRTSVTTSDLDKLILLVFIIGCVRGDKISPKDGNFEDPSTLVYSSDLVVQK